MIYYISNSGSDSTGNGSSLTPWASLYKACQMVTTPGDIIHVTAGTYLETLECTLAVGVSIEGEGDSSYIKHHFATPLYPTFVHGCILLKSTSAKTNGNQSISNIKLDGEYDYSLQNNSTRGNVAILIYNRSNVKIHHCTIVNFYISGVVFRNQYDFVSTTSAGTGDERYELGNELYNCTIRNCTDASGTWQGANVIRASYQKNLLIHDNLLYSNDRPVGYNAGIMSGYAIKGSKYYNNISYRTDYEGPNLNPPSDPYGGLPTGWNFHMEIWNTQGGFEIYNNEFHGGPCPIDVGGHHTVKGEYTYSYSIHDNLFQPIGDSLNHTVSVHGWWPITVESYYTEDVLIYNNHFKNHPQTIAIGDNWQIPLETFNQYGLSRLTFKNIFVYNNLMENSGWADGTFQALMEVRAALHQRTGTITVNNQQVAVSHEATLTDNIKFYNNTVIARSSANTQGICIYVGEPGYPGGHLTNVDIKNNIFCYCKLSSPIWVEAFGANEATIDYLTIKNNLFYAPTYSAGFSILPVLNSESTGTITHATISGNIPTSNTTQLNPLFVSSTDFHLQAASPAVNAGLDVGLSYNGIAPDIGTFEKPSVYYLAPNGNDSTGDGTLANPWFTVHKAWDYLVPGDTVYFTSGTYEYSTNQELFNKSGTLANKIKILALPGTTPIIKRATGSSANAGLYFYNVNYIQVNGLEIYGYEQIEGDSSNFYDLLGYDTNNCIFENLKLHHSEYGMGLGSINSSSIGSAGNLILNVDAYECFDPYSTNGQGAYENANGFSFNGQVNNNPNGPNIFRNCRAWLCSDDGWDLFGSNAEYRFENCWAFSNGYAMINGVKTAVAQGGNGIGFKLGPQNYGDLTQDDSLTVKKRLYNCVAFDNVGSGFDQNYAKCRIEFYNCVAHNNIRGFNISHWSGEVNAMNPTGVNLQLAHVVKNCISFGNTVSSYSTGLFNSYSTIDHNNFNYSQFTGYHYGGTTVNIPVSSSDFLSVTPGTEPIASRSTTDNSLPQMNYLHLAFGSALINAGTDVGLPYYGIAPDLGAFETEYLPKVLTVKLFIQGLFSGEGLMRKAQNETGDQFQGDIADQVTIELRNASNYQVIVHSQTVNLSTAGNITMYISSSYNGNYYITVKHRNSIETTTKNPVSFANSTVSYDFTTAATKAYGNNLKNMSGYYCIYSGDVNQDGLVDISDMMIVDNFSSSFAFGYLTADVNGDGLVDSTDMNIVDNNARNFVSKKVPT